MIVRLSPNSIARASRRVQAGVRELKREARSRNEQVAVPGMSNTPKGCPSRRMIVYWRARGKRQLCADALAATTRTTEPDMSESGGSIITWSSGMIPETTSTSLP